MNLKKSLSALVVMVGVSVVVTVPAFAGQWIFDGPEAWKWWYREDDGTYPKTQWKEIDGEIYSFNDNGYLELGWENSDLTKNGSRGEDDWVFVVNNWFYFDDSGKLLKNQNYYGGYTDENGLLQIDDYDWQTSTFLRRADFSDHSVPKPLALDVKARMVQGRFEGWEYSALDYQKDLFKKVREHMILLGEKQMTYQLPKEVGEKEKAIWIEVIKQKFVDEYGVGIACSSKVDENNIIHFWTTDYGNVEY